MYLSEFENRFFRVEKDGVFDTLGELNRHPPVPYLCFAESEKFLEEACARNDISCIITTKDLCCHPMLFASGKGVASCNSPKLAFFELHNWLVQNEERYLKRAEGIIIGENCEIHATAVIEDGVRIGKNVLIEERVIIKNNTVIGDNVVLRAGSIIGGANLTIYFTEEGILKRAIQAGKTVLGDNVEIGYHAFVAQGFFPYDVTVIQNGGFFGSNSTVSHNCKIGKNVKTSSLAHICGNTCLENSVKVGASSLITSLVKIGDHTEILLGAVVASNIRKDKKIVGNFAIDYNKFVKWYKKGKGDIKNDRT